MGCPCSLETLMAERLRPLNHATCPKCMSQNTKRGGVVKGQEAKGSLWKCFQEECRHEFHVPMVVVFRDVG